MYYIMHYFINRVEFTVGDKPINKFRMVEKHYFKERLLKCFDFEFGFCIPNSRNTVEHIYEFPELEKGECWFHTSLDVFISRHVTNHNFIFNNRFAILYKIYLQTDYHILMRLYYFSCHVLFKLVSLLYYSLINTRILTNFENKYEC